MADTDTTDDIKTPSISYFYDDNFGISVEEQKEILAKINEITEKNRRSLSDNPQGNKEEKKIPAKKKSFILPVAVNSAAVLILAAGIFILFTCNQRVDTAIREGSRTVSVTERALIEEIRRETAEKLLLKDMEIAEITSRLEEVDAQLLQLHSLGELTAEQRRQESALLESQNNYRADLAVLTEERSRILEDARVREASLRLQFDENTGAAGTNAEFERISQEHESSAAIDAQFAGSLEVIGDFMKSGEYERAAAAAGELRNFLETPAFQTLGSFAARKEIYIRSVESIENVLNELLSSDRPVREIAGAQNEDDTAELQTQIARLESTVERMQRTIDTLNSGSTNQAAQAVRLSELEDSVSRLRSENSDKDRTISSLQSDNTALNQTITARDGTIRELEASNRAHEQEIANLRNQIAVIRQALQD